MSYLLGLVIYFLIFWVGVLIAVTKLENPYLLIAAGLFIQIIADFVAKQFVPSEE